jgi:4-hydroxybenzoate polyprenyltransferase
VSPKRKPKRAPPRRRRPEASGERGPRRALAVGAASALAGLALVGVGESDFGMVLTIAGAVAMIYAIHTFGRLGPLTEERAPSQTG